MNQNARLSIRARLSDEALLDLVQCQTLDYFL